MESLFGGAVTEASFVKHVSPWLDAEQEHQAQLHFAAQYAAWGGPFAHRDAPTSARCGLFRAPHKFDPLRLIPAEAVEPNGVALLALPRARVAAPREIQLTDAGLDLTAALDQAKKCIKVHNQGKDSCSTGLKEKNEAFNVSTFGVTLAGCPSSRMETPSVR